MTHLSINEWGKVPIGNEDRKFSTVEAKALLTAARTHPCANIHGTNVLIDRRDYLYAQQVVGMVAAKGCSLEILPKVDPDRPDAEDKNERQAKEKSVRRRLVQMLDIALSLNLSEGGQASLARQNETLLEVLIRSFADKLLDQVRRGLPRRYLQRDDDLPALRGRLDVTRQFTINTVRPDKLACRFDQLEVDTPLMRVMAAAVPFLTRFARHPETQRKLGELRYVLADIPILPIARLPWEDVRIDRTNRRWKSLFELTKLLLRREWQATHRRRAAPDGLTLLFPMNDLFESYIAALLRRALAGTGIQVVEQGGLRNCLGEYSGEHLTSGSVFQTKPDIILRRNGHILAIIDTKWKKLADNPLNRKHGVSQADVYQLMAYARLYECPELMLLYPEIPGQPCGERKQFGITGGQERLSIATIDVAQSREMVEARLATLMVRFTKLSSQQ